MSENKPSRQKRTVLVTGANGTIGNGVARAFVRAGYTVYGLIRNPALLTTLAASEIIPILGSPDNLDFLPELYRKNGGARFDVIVSTTENIADYIPHFNNIITLLRTISTASNAQNTRPLVLFTSGCKDYGTTPYHLTPTLTPHTEASPLSPPLWAANRANYSESLISPTSPFKNLFDTILLRPTTIYGYHSSFYGPYFDLAARAKEKGVLELPEERRNVVLHGTHVDDCGDAYVKLADTYLSSPSPASSILANSCYNISSHRYETLSEIADALVQEYGIPGGVRWISSSGGEGGKGGEVEKSAENAFQTDKQFDILNILTGYSQWVSSEKLRKDTGWGDRRMLFSQGIEIYRLAYEAAVERGDGGVQKVKTRIAGVEG